MFEDSSSSESVSRGVGRLESGRLPRRGRRGLGMVTGVGESEGSFSLEALASESDSESEPGSFFRVGGLVENEDSSARFGLRFDRMPEPVVLLGG